MIPSVRTLVALVVWGALVAPVPATAAEKTTAAEKEARAFLDVVTTLAVPLFKVSGEVAWVAATQVSEEHTGARAGADRAVAALVGNPWIIERTRAFLARRKELTELTTRQLERLLLSAAESPGTIPEVVARRVQAEARQSALLDGFTFCGKRAPAKKANPGQPANAGKCLAPMTANDIDRTLRNSKVLAERERVWTVSKEIGISLKSGLAELVKVRNEVARAMGFPSFFALQTADYGMTPAEMMTLLDASLEATRPLYDGLHCWAKHELAGRYRAKVPTLLPAHWVTNRWAQEWPGLLAAANLDPLFARSKPEQIVKFAEDFYVSLGFPRLPATFWERSDLYPVPKGDPRKKNSHASAWHVDLGHDVRSLMSVEANAEWFGTSHHELGHIYYYLSYTRPEIPPLVRGGANRAFHEAVGELARLASEQAPYLAKMGLLAPGKGPDPKTWLLSSALDSIVFMAFSAGTMSHFEFDLYEGGLAPEAWQERWWQYVARYQGVVPPGPRPPEACDACTKTHLNDDPAQYYDYALATLIKFQLHGHICEKILKQDVRACDYSGNKAVGDFLRGILSTGASRDWRRVMRDATGEDIGPRAMLAFFEPLAADLASRNAGRNCAR